MMAITLHQPWASLIALGVKTIETRSWRTRHRGPLAIHAAKRQARPEDMERLMAGSDIDRLPYGAVVAVCRLTDCAPIGGPTSFLTGTFEGDEGDWYGSPVIVYHQADPGLGLSDYLALDQPTAGHDITGQLPYGDYSEGRWGWLLDDIQPVGPFPAVGRQGLWQWPPAPALLAAG